MKNKIITILLAVIILNINNALAQVKVENNLQMANSKDYKQLFSNYNEYYNKLENKKASGYKPFKRMEYFWEPRLYPNGFIRPAKEILNDYYLAQKNKYSNSLQAYKAKWTELGPINVPVDAVNDGTGIGRINCVELDPNYMNNIWVGSSMGGAWKSIDGGDTWECVDFTTFLSMGVTDIEVAPSNSDVVYISTGDADGTNMTNGYTIGVVKTTDAGKTWNTTGLDYDIIDQCNITELNVNPEDENIVLAATSRGIYKTTDGGLKWNVVPSGGYYREMLSAPNDPNIVYTTTTGSNASIYRSTNFGDSWEKVWQSGSGVRIRLAVCKKNPSKVYALVADGTMEQNGRVYGLLGFYISSDYGMTWEETSGKSPNLLGWDTRGKDLGGQGHYDLGLAVNPSNENTIIVGGVNTWKSTDGGYNWECISTWYRSHDRPYVHADQHDIVFDYRNGDLFIANDGGIYKTEDFNDSEAWQDLSDGISVGQFYRMSVASTDKLFLVVGAQDNGTHIYKNSKWLNVAGADGMDCEINPNDSNVVYYSIYNGGISATFDGFKTTGYIMHQGITNETAAWCAPIYLDIQNPNIVYAGFQNVWRSSDRGSTWSKFGNLPSANSATVTNITSSPTDNSYVYAMAKTQLFKKKGNNEWENIFNSAGYLTSGVVDKNDPEKIWVSVSGYNKDSKVYLITKDEKINMSAGLPNIPINDLLLLDDNKTIIAASDIGVFIKDDLDKPWRLFSDGMPSLVCNDLEFSKETGILSVATFGRGVWQTNLINCDIVSPILTFDNDLEFCDGDSVNISISNPEIYSKFKWSTGETTPTITVKNSGNYFVTVKNSQGCEENSQVITVNTLPFKDIVVKSDKNVFAFCTYPDTLNLSANLGYQTYLWSTGSTERKITVTEPGEYWVEVEAKNGCKGKSKVFNIVISEFPPKPTITQDTISGELICSEIANSYIWYKNGKEIDSSNTQRIKYKSSGLYTVSVFNEAGCSTISDEFDLVTSVYEFSKGTSIFNIYPNPASKSIKIEYSKEGNNKINLSLYNHLGKELKQYSNLNFNNILYHHIDVDNYPDGTYFIKIENGDNIIIKKFLKIK